MPSLNDFKSGLDLISYLRKIWESKKAIAILLLVVLMLGVWFLYTVDVAKLKSTLTGINILVLCGVCGGIFIIWYFTRKPRKINKDKIGIAIAIATDNKKAQERLKDDFVDNLKNIIKAGHHQRLQIMALSEYHSKKINDDISANKYHAKTRARLIIYGKCKIRMHEGKECYYLKLDASVVHRPLPEAISKSIGQEMRNILPPNLIFRADDEIKGFMVTAETLGHGSRYIIGLASLFSGYIDTAFDLHNGLIDEIDLLEKNNSESISSDLATIRKLIPLHLSDEALILSEIVYRNKKDKYLEKMNKYLDIVKRFDPRNYKAHILRGIYYFLHKRDTRAALDEIRMSRNEKDQTWQLNEAFIKAYEGDLEGAHKSYKRAALAILGCSVPIETECFIYDILQLEPDKIQLWYCLGMVNYFIKGDLISAKKCFETFTELAKNQNRFDKSLDFAEKYLKEINTKLTKAQIPQASSKSNL